MEKRDDGLWQGGAWERSGPQLNPPPVVVPEARPTVLRPRRRRRRYRLRWQGWLLVALFAVGVVGTALNWSRYYYREAIPHPGTVQEQRPKEKKTEGQPPTIRQAETGTGVTVTLADQGTEPLTYTQIYERNLPSIVSIESVSKAGRATGTGIVLTPDGYIVTNAHIIADGVAVAVTFHNNLTLEARLVGFDGKEDLAVLKVEADNLIPAQFGDSSQLRCGDPVAAMGDAMGYRRTITDGIISALDREVEMNGRKQNLIQTSAAINAGSSGGALLNQYGQVVGITTMKLVASNGSAESMGFAIPSRRVKFVADTLIDGRLVRPCVFGIVVSTQPVEGGGLQILEVEPWSDAKAGGVQPKDVIIEVNGQPVHNTQDLDRIKLELGEGDPVEMVCLRQGTPCTLNFRMVAPRT